MVFYKGGKDNRWYNIDLNIAAKDHHVLPVWGFADRVMAAHDGPYVMLWALERRDVSP